MIYFEIAVRKHSFSAYAKYFEKHFLPPNSPPTCTLQGVRNVSFFEEFCERIK